MTAILPSLYSFFPPFMDMVGEGLLRPRHHSGNGRRPQLKIPCQVCGMPLIEIAVNNHFRLVCDNYHCRLFRECQGNRAKNPGVNLSHGRRVNPSDRPLSNYQKSLNERKARYRFACDLGFSPIEAMHLRGKTMEEIERLAGVRSAA